MHHSDKTVMLASLKHYLLELQESGVDGVQQRIPEQTLIPSPVMNDIPVREPVSIELPESLEKIRKNLGECQRCGLAGTRKKLVFGAGNPHARLVFVGEGPGADEDAQGEPFVGDAGKVLTRLINAMGLQRTDVYICNVVKCRPPGNRNPEPGEIATCSPFLRRQLQSIQPEVIVALGKFAAQTLLETKEPITRLRGKFRDYHGTPLMPTYHPSYLLRNRTDSEPYWDVWQDMSQVLHLLKLPVPEKSRKNSPSS